jgi:CRISPR system Cascade subunit CasE
MFFSRILVAGGPRPGPEFWKSAGSLYDMHKAVWGLFADRPDRKRDFLYRMDQVTGRPVVYMVSERAPADPSGLFMLETKPYEPVVRTGQRFSFMLRANPVVMKKDDQGRHHRHDVVMDTRKKVAAGPDGQAACTADLVTSAGMSWLVSRGGTHGFVPVNGRTVVEGYQQHRFRGRKGPGDTRFSTLDFSGVLTVSDPDLFREALYKGVGPAKGFGCGLMIVRPHG